MKRAASAARQAASILDDLRRVARALRESSRRAERPLGVSGAELLLLRSLAEGEGLSVNELAQRARAHQSTVSVAVKHLVERGLIRRSSSKLDARRVQLSVTRRGHQLLARAPRAAPERLVASIEKLSRAHRSALADGLHQLVALLQQAAPATRPEAADEQGASERRNARRRAP